MHKYKFLSFTLLELSEIRNPSINKSHNILVTWKRKEQCHLSFSCIELKIRLIHLIRWKNNVDFNMKKTGSRSSWIHLICLIKLIYYKNRNYFQTWQI